MRSMVSSFSIMFFVSATSVYQEKTKQKLLEDRKIEICLDSIVVLAPVLFCFREKPFKCGGQAEDYKRWLVILFSVCMIH